MILAGDIGGTKTHLALYPLGGKARRPVRDRRFRSADHTSLESMVQVFLAGAEAADQPIARAAFGIAGPVIDNRCETTHLPWSVYGDALARALGGATITLINDLAATGIGIDALDPADLDTLQTGTPALGNRAVIAAGTGLGEAALARNGARWLPVGSEGGHADFAPRTPLEDALNLWLRAKYGRASVERLLSGPGLADLYRFLSDTGRGAESAEFAARFAAATDPAALVTEGAQEGSCERARLALQTFIEAYGAEAGNLALRTLPTQGLYVGGGIAPRVRAAFRDPRFLAAFRDKPPMTALLERIPVHLILDAQTALWGAAIVALAEN